MDPQEKERTKAELVMLLPLRPRIKKKLKGGMCLYKDEVKNSTDDSWAKLGPNEKKSYDDRAREIMKPYHDAVAEYIEIRGHMLKETSWESLLIQDLIVNKFFTGRSVAEAKIIIRDKKATLAPEWKKVLEELWKIREVVNRTSKLKIR